MKRTWMGVIMAGAILSNGCATIAGGAVDLSGARSGPAMRPAEAGPGSALTGSGTSSGAGDAMTFQKGPVYATGGEDHHSFADPAAHRPSPTSPLGVDPRVPILVGPEDSPLAEWGILEFGVKGLPGADIRRLGLIGYAKSWAEDGLGRNVADISQNPATIYTHVQFRVFPGGGARRLLLY